MCLLTVYLKKDKERKLIANEVAFIQKDENTVNLQNIEFNTVASLENVELVSIDTLNSVLILKNMNG